MLGNESLSRMLTVAFGLLNLRTRPDGQSVLIPGPFVQLLTDVLSTIGEAIKVQGCIEADVSCRWDGTASGDRTIYVDAEFSVLSNPGSFLEVKDRVARQGGGLETLNIGVDRFRISLRLPLSGPKEPFC